MKNLSLSFNNVSYLHGDNIYLDNFCLDIESGEILGFMPVNDTGLDVLLKLFKQNIPINKGSIIYDGEEVNTQGKADYSYNNIAIINNASMLADSLSLADNVFVLKHGFKQRIIKSKLLNQQLKLHLNHVGINVKPNSSIKKLSNYQRFVIEIIKAVVAGSKLIVLLEPASIISYSRLQNLYEIIKTYSNQGISFLYISRHYEEINKLCKKATIMLNGQIVKILNTEEVEPQQLKGLGIENFTNIVLQNKKENKALESSVVFEFNKLVFGKISNISFTVNKGECVVLQDLNNHIFDDVLKLLMLDKCNYSGEILVANKKLSKQNRHDVAIIQQEALNTMLFNELSYTDNLFFNIDKRFKNIWLSNSLQSSILNQLDNENIKKHKYQSIDKLTNQEKYELIYTRVLLQKPKIVVCVQPFMKADMNQRMEIWKLLNNFLNNGISLLILSVNLADTLSLADRLIQVQKGKILKSYTRENYKDLPDSIPWHNLWQSK